MRKIEHVLFHPKGNRQWLQKTKVKTRMSNTHSLSVGKIGDFAREYHSENGNNSEGYLINVMQIAITNNLTMLH